MANGWIDNDLTNAAPGAPNPPSGGPRGYMFSAQDTQHVNYCGPELLINESIWQANGWIRWTRTRLPVGPTRQATHTGTFSILPGTQHVDYLGPDNHIHELWWGPDGWQHNDLAIAAGAANALSNPCGYVFDRRAQHVSYLGVDHHIHELWCPLHRRDPLTRVLLP